ncbi:hypothetical protein TRFO_19262 [Tritrichomonas foetus]|uniref:I/LWEQ domain-containing protein n=1 Tax=Tritrichomonas foetus TaxID=1144522 RepID=A0A1J4KK88_9EUKA|nr:hypothetical protein TRFO_19262 [Tritrichomonas foetus]|eukprot:OHT11368.1 hypothetical protein TRFO_19262 [Tritrichomonas foetus]
MSAYNSFASAVSKYQLKKIEELMTDDRVSLRLNDIGCCLGRSIQMASSLRSLARDFIDILPLTSQGPQIEIGHDYHRMCALNQKLQANIMKHDSSFPPEQQCKSYIDELMKTLKDIEQYIPHLISSTASSMSQYLDSLSANVTHVMQFYDKIMDVVNSCESQLSQKIGQSQILPNEQQISYQIAAAIAAMEELTIRLVYLSANPQVQASQNFKELQSWIDQVSKLAQSLLKLPKSDSRASAKQVVEISSQFPILAGVISRFQPLIPDSIDFTYVSVALTNVMQTLNDIESKATMKDISEIIKTLAPTLLNDKPLDPLLGIATELLGIVHPKISLYGAPCISAYGTLVQLLQACNNKTLDRDWSASCVVSIIRLVSRMFPDAKVGEEILVSLSRKIALITKSIFKDCRKLLTQISSVVDTNLEFFNDIALNEVNYFLTLARNIEDFDTEANDFVETQQQFFDSLCALPTPLVKLISTCPDQETKTQLTSLIEQLQNYGNRFSRWLNHFYLVLFTIIHNRADMVASTLSFPITMLCSSNQQPQIQNVLTCISQIQKIIQTTPQIMLGDLKDVNSLILNIVELSKIGNEFIKCVNQNQKSPIFLLYKQAADALSKIIVNLPSYIDPLPGLTNFEDNDTFICALIASLSRSLNLLQITKQMIEKADATSYAFFSAPFTYILTIDTLIHAQQQASVTLFPFMSNLRNSLDVVWSISVQIAAGQKPPEASHLPTYAQSIIKAIEELLGSILSLKQPSLPYDVPDDVQEIKRFDNMASSLYSTTLKTFAQFVVRTMKKSTAADVRSAMNQWFDATQIVTVEVAVAVAKINESIIQLMNASTTDRSLFIEQFAALSVSLATYENSYGKTVAPIIGQLHRNLVTLVLEFLETSRNSQPQLMKIHGCISEISSLTPISKLKQKEMEDYLANILKRVVISIHILREKGRDAQLNDTLSAITSLEELCAFYQVSPPTDDLGVNELISLIANGKSKKQNLDQAVMKFSERLLQLLPNQFNALDRIRDTDTVCDFVYDKAELFREDVNTILQLAKAHDQSEENVSRHLNSMLLYASDAAVLTMHSLMLAGLAFTPLSATFVACFSELQIALRQFSDTAFNISKKKNEDLSPELRRINRKMSKQFDTFINIVENPQRPTNDSSEFEQSKTQMYANLSTVVVQIARLNSLAATSLVPEMYTDNRLEIVENIDNSLLQLNSAISLTRNKAVGQSSIEMGNLATQLESQVKSLVQSSEKLTFGAIFTPKPLLKPCEDVCIVTNKMAVLGPTLTDRIIIEPDPAAAARIQEDYVVPPLPKSAPPPAEALQNLILTQRKLDETLAQFKTVIKTTLATSGELLEAAESIRTISNAFAEKALLMAVATVDPRYQVEQQTALHAFANSVNGVQAAMKSRLMRTPKFGAEMEEALSAFNSSISKSMELAEFASKIEAHQEDDSLDEVTRELNATALAIEKMSAKLKEFEEQVNMENIDVNVDVDSTAAVIHDIQAAAGTLPAFLIASANPILAATTQILKRAQEITAGLIQKFGRIENEKGLIKAAQDLSEAAELLLICAELLVGGEENDTEFKVIASAKIIKAAVATLVAQVLVKGGDSEGIMSNHVRTVQKYTDGVIKRAEAIVDEKLTEEKNKKPKRKATKMVLKLNQQSEVGALRAKLQEEEKKLTAFRRRFYHKD